MQTCAGTISSAAKDEYGNCIRMRNCLLYTSQLQTATAREFVRAVRLEDVREKEKYPYLARVEKLIRDQGFDVRRADLAAVKRDVYKRQV